MGRNERIKREIAREAAQLLYAEESRSHHDARSQAARRFGSGVSTSRGAHLPEYAEIHTEFWQLLQFYGREALAQRVHKWRLLALKYLQILETFQPLLTGSVLRGEVRAISDINLQLFYDKPEEVGYFLEREGIPFCEEGDAEHTRFYLEEEGVEIECVVYPLLERRQTPHSRITGRPLERADYKRLRELIKAKDGKGVEMVKHFSGSCGCGRIQYEITTARTNVVNCHCNKCRKYNGSSFSTYFVVSAKRFKLVAGEEFLARYAPTDQFSKNFCKTCGSPLFNQNAKYPNLKMVHFGTLDLSEGIKPNVNIYCESRLPWVLLEDEIRDFDQEMTGR